MIAEEILPHYTKLLNEITGKEVQITCVGPTSTKNFTELDWYIRNGKPHDQEVAFTILLKDKSNWLLTNVASFSLRQLPGCCGVLVSYHGRVYNPYRKMGIGTLLNQMKIDIARVWGYTTLLCTDVIDNQPQRKILGKNGWKDIHTFTNKRTGNLVAITVRDLR